jgi:hypothetical protein
MKLDQSSSALVIVGGWNSHIFITPRWIKRFLFPEEEFTLELQGQLLQSLNGQFLHPCISSKDIRILLQGNKLNFIPLKNGDENLDRIQDLALQLADYLPHTPVSGYRVNFLFTEDHVNEDLVDLIRPGDLEEIEQFGASLTGEEYTRRLELNERILNFTVGLKNERTTFKFNFHSKINDLIAFKAGISKTSILELKQEAIQFISEIYNLELEGETE